MKISVVHTDPAQQPVAATVAKQIHQSLPAGQSTLTCASQADPRGGDLALVVFSLRPGAYAPTVPYIRELRDRKVAFVAVLAGPVDNARVRKSFWGIKKQFCGNELQAGYLCQADDDVAWGLSETELRKILAFARKFYDDNQMLEEPALAVNY